MYLSIFFHTIRRCVNSIMENVVLDKLDENAIIDDRKVNQQETLRINNMGQIEEYREGYWQVVDWKYSNK